MKDFLININGELFQGPEAKISVFDRGFLYGDSVYESTRTFESKPFRLEQHLDRLFSSAEKISFRPIYSKEDIRREVLKTIAASPHKNVAIRIVLTRGNNRDLNLDPTFASENNLVIFTRPIANNPEWWYRDGVSMIFYKKTADTQGPLPKTGNYQENIKAFNEAKTRGAYDALMINTRGFVTEGTTSNVWLIKNSILYTPALADGVLEGLTRKTLVEMSHRQALPLPLIEKSLCPADFIQADECFITSTTRNIVPVTTLDGQKVGTGKPGAVTLELLARYLDFVK